MNNDIINCSLEEDFEEYRYRIYKAKHTGQLKMTWVEIAELFAQNWGVLRDESTWRKEARELLVSQVDETTSKDEEELAEESLKKDLNELILEFKKERVKISDERTQNNAYIRRLAREDTIIEIAKNAAKEMSSKKILDTYEYPSDLDTREMEAIIQLSDWHYGIEIDNFLNTFNPGVCIERIKQLLGEAISYLTKNPVRKIHVVNLGDLISGRIHSTIRLESRYDVITQTLHVAEIVAEFLSELSAVAPIEYYDCLDNHSRIEPNKKDSLDLESLARIIPWHLNFRFKNNENINIRYNDFGEDIIAFNVMDKWTIGGVHGHKDKPTKVIDNLTMLTKVKFDMILTAHLHHFNADEKNETLQVSNGSLMGTDQYAFDLRLSSKPSQNIILANYRTPMYDLHRVVLD